MRSRLSEVAAFRLPALQGNNLRARPCGEACRRDRPSPGGACPGRIILCGSHGARRSAPAHRLCGAAGVDRAAAHAAGRRRAGWRSMAPRNQIRRLPHACASRARRGEITDAHRARLDPQISGDSDSSGRSRRARGLSRRRAVRRRPRRHHRVQYRPTGIGQRQRGGAGVLPVRSSPSRQRGSAREPADRA